MEVTNENFNALLPQIERTIKDATFLAIDCEFTGLNRCNNINAFDTQRQYYSKIRGAVVEFLAIQYGICAFRYDEDSKEFKQSCFNFYVFPRPVNRNIPDPRFLCQTSSIEFLSSKGFDFNKLFKKGIPYLNATNEAKYTQTLNEIQTARAHYNSTTPKQTQNNLAVPPGDKPFIDDVFKQIHTFLKSDVDEWKLPQCNSFVRRLIYQNVSDVLKDEAYLETRKLENNDRILVAVRGQKDEKNKEVEEQQRLVQEKEALQTAIGFSKVIKILVQSGKMIVGHNLLMDLLHTMDKFLSPLPVDYEEFKEYAHCLFPRILDTKYMSSIEPFKDIIQSNVLGHLLETVTKEPFVLPKVVVDDNDAQGYVVEDTKQHEAGYDAYMTGLCFLSMCQYLGKTQGENQTILPDSKLLKPFVNRIHLMRLDNSPFIHLGGKDPTTPRDHVFYLTFPKNWKLNDLFQLFSPFGNVYVSWIDSSSAYISLNNRSLANIALKTLSQSDTYTIMTYAKRQAILDANSTYKEESSKTPSSSTQKKRPAPPVDAEIANKRRKVDIGKPVIKLFKKEDETEEMEDEENDDEMETSESEEEKSSSSSIALDSDSELPQNSNGASKKSVAATFSKLFKESPWD